MPTLKEKTQIALDALPAGAAGPHLLRVADSGQDLTCELTEIGSLGCALDHLTLQTAALADASIEQVKQLAETLAGRLSYLLEAISPVEFDAEQCVVQMRSSPPQEDDDGTSYYELLVRRGGELSLRRYSKSGGQTRVSIPAHITREVLLRLIDDFSAVAP